MQIWSLQKELRSKGISSDTVDLHALVDSKLSYPENARNILNRYKRTDNAAKKSKKGTHHGGVGNVDLKYAAQYHQSRSPAARATDEARGNRKTYSERDISRNPSLLSAWYRNPGNSDIIGIDAPPNYKPHKRKTTKRKTKKKTKKHRR